MGVDSIRSFCLILHGLCVRENKGRGLHGSIRIKMEKTEKSIDELWDEVLMKSLEVKKNSREFLELAQELRDRCKNDEV